MSGKSRRKIFEIFGRQLCKKTKNLFILCSFGSAKDSGQLCVSNWKVIYCDFISRKNLLLFFGKQGL